MHSRKTKAVVVRGPPRVQVGHLLGERKPARHPPLDVGPQVLPRVVQAWPLQLPPYPAVRPAK